MHMLATDLDRTLLPNGLQKANQPIKLFKNIVKKEKLKLFYVTGRNLKEVKEAISEFGLPAPDWVVAELGTKIFFKKNNKFTKDKEWDSFLDSAVKKWNPRLLKKNLRKIQGLKLQKKDRQNKYKLSYYIDDTKNSKRILTEATKEIEACCSNASIIYSVEQTKNRGLLDILTKQATKINATEYLRKKYKAKKENVIYSGDSGNDILPLTFGYKSILVRNARKEIKTAVKRICAKKKIQNTLYIAKGYKKLNGHYYTGIIEGLIKFKVITPKYAQ